MSEQRDIVEVLNSWAERCICDNNISAGRYIRKCWLGGEDSESIQTDALDDDDFGTLSCDLKQAATELQQARQELAKLESDNKGMMALGGYEHFAVLRDRMQQDVFRLNNAIDMLKKERDEQLATRDARIAELEAGLRSIAEKRTHAGVWMAGEQDTTSFLRMTQCYDIADKALTQQEPDDE